MKDENDNIEQFFKKRLTNQEYVFDEAQWDKLEQKLDAQEAIPDGPGTSSEDSDGIFIFRMVALLFVISCIAFFLGWYLRGTEYNSYSEQELEKELFKGESANSDKKGNTIELGENKIKLDEAVSRLNTVSDQLNKQQKLELKEENNEIDRVEPDSENLKIKKEKVKGDEQSFSKLQKDNSLKNDLKHQVIVEESKETDVEEKEEKNEKDVGSVGKRGGTIDSGNISDQTLSKINDSEGNELLLITDSVSTTEDVNDEVSSKLIIDNRGIKELSLLKIQELALRIDFPNSLIEEGVYSDELMSDSVNIDSTKQKRKWAINLFVAPDFNSTSMSKLFDSFGQSVGVTVDYYIGNKLKVEVGGIINNKEYLADADDYTPMKGFWTNGVAPENTDAKCLVLDIPINIGYNLIGNNIKKNLWINAGVSSYWMLTEEYRYIYENPDPDLVKWWRGERENFHFLGAMNMSVKYEKKVNNKISYILNPYFKMPLKGIGHGAVNLLSGGFNVGIKYHPSRKMKK